MQTFLTFDWRLRPRKKELQSSKIKRSQKTVSAQQNIKSLFISYYLGWWKENTWRNGKGSFYHFECVHVVLLVFACESKPIDKKKAKRIDSLLNFLFFLSYIFTLVLSRTLIRILVCQFFFSRFLFFCKSFFWRLEFLLCYESEINSKLCLI